MSRLKNPTEFDITVAGEPYVWTLHRQPGWSGDDAKPHGMSILVRHAEGKREVMVEFPAGPKPRLGAPQLKASQIATELVARAIGSAVAAGWEPLSRGKTVTIIVDATGG
jgi:hypothetical protein